MEATKITNTFDRKLPSDHALTPGNPEMKLPFTTSIISNPSLPALYHDPRKYEYHAVDEDNIDEFTRNDLDVSRLEAVQDWLWIAGRKIAARPLHRQEGILGRTIVVTEQADLHLMWDGTRIFIKPLPAYLLNAEFWHEHLCNDQKTYNHALGFLLSYVWLIPFEVDFYLATDEQNHPRLLPRVTEDGQDLTYEMWRSFVREFVSRIDPKRPRCLVKTRWEHGELRINRLNLIYRFCWTKLGMAHISRGYLYGYQDYASFLERNFAWLLAAFAYVSVVHGAMQVGAGVPQLEENTMFLNACYGFAVFTIVAPIGAVGIMLLFVILIFLDNLRSTLWHLRKVERKRTGTVTAPARDPPAP